MRILLAALGLALPLYAQTAPPAGKMWLLEDAPVEHVREVYGVELTKEWLETARRSGLKFGGGTASFVSAPGRLSRAPLPAIAGPPYSDHSARAHR